MAAKMLSVILIDPGALDHSPVLAAMAKRGFECKTAISPDEAIQHLQQADFDALVIYQRAAKGFGEFLTKTRSQHPGMAIIVVIPEYDGDLECRLFNLQVDDVVTSGYPPSLLALRTAIRVRNHQWARQS